MSEFKYMKTRSTPGLTQKYKKERNFVPKSQLEISTTKLHNIFAKKQGFGIDDKLGSEGVKYLDLAKQIDTIQYMNMDIMAVACDVHLHMDKPYGSYKNKINPYIIYNNQDLINIITKFKSDIFNADGSVKDPKAPNGKGKKKNLTDDDNFIIQYMKNLDTIIDESILRGIKNEETEKVMDRYRISVLNYVVKLYEAETKNYIRQKAAEFAQSAVNKYKKDFNYDISDPKHPINKKYNTIWSKEDEDDKDYIARIKTMTGLTANEKNFIYATDKIFKNFGNKEESIRQFLDQLDNNFVILVDE